MPDRTSNSSSYRYGYNGKEDDREIEGQQDYGFRIYDRRLARFKSVDPLTASYPFYTPYQFAGNTPIQAIDLDGAEPIAFGTVTTETTGRTLIWMPTAPKNRPATAPIGHWVEMLIVTARQVTGNITIDFSINKPNYTAPYIPPSVKEMSNKIKEHEAAQDNRSPGQKMDDMASRLLYPDFFTISFGGSSIVGAGPTLSQDWTWQFRGEERSLAPVATLTPGLGSGFDVGGGVGVTGTWYLGSEKEIRRRDISSDAKEALKAQPTFVLSAGPSFIGKADLTWSFTPGKGFLGIVGGQVGIGISVGYGVPLGPVPVNGSVSSSASYKIMDLKK